MTDTIERIADVTGARAKHGGGFLGHCPAHDDRTPSLSIDRGDNGNPVVKCYAGCSQETVIDALRVLDVWPVGTGKDANKEELEKARQRSEQRKAERRNEQDKTAAMAVKVWRQAGPADHPYLDRKQTKPTDTLRQINLAPLKKPIGYHPQANGIPFADGPVLIIPVVVNGRMSTLEMIDKNGLKSALKGGGKKDGYWSTQKLPEGNGEGLTLLIGEGAATCLSGAESTRCPAVAALSCGNLLSVARQMRARYPKAEITLLADLVKTTGAPDHHAIEAAREIGGKLAIPDFGHERPEGMTDFNDLFVKKGQESVKICIEAGVLCGQQAPAAADQQEQGPMPLPDELLPVEPFDFALLPDNLRAWAQDIADRLQCPADFVGVAIMATLAAVIGRKVGIRPQGHTSWTVVCNMWALIIGRPGVLKSPAIEEVLGPIKRLVAIAQEAFDKEKSQYDTIVAVSKLRAEEHLKSVKKNMGTKTDEELLAALTVGEIEEPSLHRYMVNDTSPASLGEVLRFNPNGLLIHRDEMVSLLKGLDREDQAEGRGFYLTGWNGDSSYTIDRIGRGLNLYIPAVCLSLLGGTQPGRISEYISAAIKGGTADDGLIQRFGLMVWPDIGGVWKNMDTPPDAKAKKQAFEIYEYLDKLIPANIGAQQDTDINGEPDGIPYLRFDAEALALFLEWRTSLESRLRGDELHPALESHFAKYRKLTPSLALIIHLADGQTGPVGRQSTLKALAWSEYLESHARRAYTAGSQPNVTTAKAILKRIKKSDLATSFSSRDVWRPGWSMLTDRDKVKEGLQLLVDYNHLTEERVETGGRPATIYHVNEAQQ